MKMFKLIEVLNKRICFLILYGILLVFALIPYYTDGCLILGGEGDYVLDFSNHLVKNSFMWLQSYGTGLSNMAPAASGLNIFSLYFIEKLTGSVSITNFSLIFLFYFFPFLAMYLVCKEMQTTPFISFISSFFYVINPFMLCYLINLNQWNAFSVTVMPLFLWVILKYYHHNFKLFFFFGLISVCFSFAYSNPPLFVIVLISVPLSTFITSYYHDGKVIFAKILKKWYILAASFLIFNSWWILPLFAGTSAAKKMHTYSFAKSWLDITVSGHSPIIPKMFSLTTIIAKNPSYDFFSYWYSTIFARLITLVPILMIVYFVLINKKTRNLLNYAIFCVLLIILFLSKGNGSPFGFIYEFMFNHLPLFYMFKSPTEKFGLLYVFIFSILLLFVMNGIKNQKYYKLVLGVFIAYLVFCSIPIITRNIIPDYSIDSLGYASRKYKDKDEYKQFRELINNDNFQYRILSLPSVGNFQACMPNYNNKKYTGLDPVLWNTNKPFIATQNHIELLYENISLANYRKFLGIYNIGKIMINEDLIPWFGLYGKRERSGIERYIF